MITINNDCVCCEQCTGECSQGALFISGNRCKVDYFKCIECQECVLVCPMYAIEWSNDV